MSPVINGQLLFKGAVTGGSPIPGGNTEYSESATIELDNASLNGGILLKNIALSVELYMMARMRPASAPGHGVPYVEGKPVENYGVGVVLRSEDPNVKAGEHYYGDLPFEQYTIRKDTEDLLKLNNAYNLPWSLFVGTLGMAGQTAYYGWKEYAKPKKGEVAFVSSAAGTVGSLIVQLAKADGLKVIASAGSDEKVAFLKDIGADVAFNYKTSDTKEVLQKEGPINIYWDNVGGATLEAALDAAARGATFIECGMISTFTSPGYNVKNLFNIVTREIKIFGFIVANPQLIANHHDAFYEDLPERIAKGEIKYKEDRTYGLKDGGKVILDCIMGANDGKKVIVLE
ncbi:Medium-chain dehydrogenase/reductase [Abortiporus biennis]